MAANLFSLAGRVAFVTGGNSGIGLALALGLRGAGARVAIGGRRVSRNRAALAQLGDESAAFTLDVRDEGSVERALREIVEHYGRLDILVNNAGVANSASVAALERSAWDRVVETNLTGAFLCTKHAVRRMMEQHSGKIINVASIYGLTAPSKGRLIAYTVSKHGLIGLTRVNAVELAPLGIQVNAIAPGYYFTEMNAELRGRPFERAVARRTPDCRWGETKDLVGTCVYLASSCSDHVTGTCAVVDGGYLASDGLDRG
jgi:NAD(P)-dependent dehydrogenase (short-subunit alcohol dehydrogenase family)